MKDLAAALKRMCARLHTTVLQEVSTPLCFSTQESHPMFIHAMIICTRRIAPPTLQWLIIHMQGWAHFADIDSFVGQWEGHGACGNSFPGEGKTARWLTEAHHLRRLGGRRQAGPDNSRDS